MGSRLDPAIAAERTGSKADRESEVPTLARLLREAFLPGSVLESEAASASPAVRTYQR
jgi:hypothetical protein